MTDRGYERRHEEFQRIHAGKEEPISNFPESYHLLREVTVDVRLAALGNGTAPTRGALTYKLMRGRNPLMTIRDYQYDEIERGTIFTFGEIASATASVISWQRELRTFDQFVIMNETDVPLFGLSLDFDPLRVRQESVSETRFLQRESEGMMIHYRGRERHE